VTSFTRVPRSETEIQSSNSGFPSPVSGFHVVPRWTVSNILSLSRVVLLFPIVSLILKGRSEYRLTVLVLMLAATATDFFDGMIARVMNQVTDFGKLLDPIADKICVVAAVVALVVVGDVPIWYAVLVAIRDILILVGGSLILKQRKVVVQSVWAGKFTVAFIAAYLILATADMKSLAFLKIFSLYGSTLLLFISLLIYIRVYRKQMARVGV